MHRSGPKQRFVQLAALARYLGCSPDTLRRDARAGILRAGRLPLHYSDDRPRAHGNARRRWVIYERDVADYLDKIRSGARLPIGLFRKQ